MLDFIYRNGLEALKNRNFEKAILYFTEVLNIEKSSAAFSNRAFAYYHLGKLDLSKLDFEKSIELIKNSLNDAKDSRNIDKWAVEFIRAKSTIAQINIQNKNFEEAEMDYFLIMGLYKLVKDESLIQNDIHISHTYKNRAAVRYMLNKIDDSIRDVAAAYVESNTNDLRMEIVDFAAATGLTDEVRKSIEVYSLFKKSKS